MEGICIALFQAGDFYQRFLDSGEFCFLVRAEDFI